MWIYDLAAAVVAIVDAVLLFCALDGLRRRYLRRGERSSRERES